MIPFASQRAGGQDLATHLQNDLDNDYMEVAEVRGAIATDLHGAFAEWELQAHGLTKCEKYLYSLSINPWDQVNGPMSREQYADYIDRVEDRLGLSGQPRAVVYHIKDGREHAHVVWSRIDTVNEKAIQLSFDHQTLMMVTREFARDHGIILPDGYEHEREGRNKQNTLAEQFQQNLTGLSKEERMERITAAWRASDNAQAFVQALSQADRRDRLKAAHEERRKPIEEERQALREQQERERKTLAREQAQERGKLFDAFAKQEKQIRPISPKNSIARQA